MFVGFQNKQRWFHEWGMIINENDALSLYIILVYYISIIIITIIISLLSLWSLSWLLLLLMIRAIVNDYELQSWITMKSWNVFCSIWIGYIYESKDGWKNMNNDWDTNFECWLPPSNTWTRASAASFRTHHAPRSPWIPVTKQRPQTGIYLKRFLGVWFTANSSRAGWKQKYQFIRNQC